MSNLTFLNPEDDMSQEYDFKKGVRGKHIDKFPHGINQDMIPEQARDEWKAHQNNSNSFKSNTQ